MRNKVVVLIIMLFLLVNVEASCMNEQNDTIHIMQPKAMDRIWIKEYDQYVAFIILEKTEKAYLVIREHTTGPSAFSYINSPNSYYANSELDDFLNTEYAGRFSTEVSHFFLKSYIQITTESSIGCCGGTTEYIKRIFYVPSWAEMTGRHNSSYLQEGNLISEAFKITHIKATNDAGAPSAWWLRTPSTWHYNRVLGINEEGGVSAGSTMDSSGVYVADVRPMFRISTKISILRINDEWFIE